MINVTKTYLPDKNKFIRYVDKIYSSGWVTNRGPLVKELEERLSSYLGVKNVVLVSNGTAALEVAYRALSLSGDVITTPFSFVATTSSLVSNSLAPKFADIDVETFNISPMEIDKRITCNTSAIVPVHVFGNACDVGEIDRIAKLNNLKVIYDAAHAFGVEFGGQSLLNFGDVSTLSFHATKLFHSIEGGALIVNDESILEKVRLMINFGIDGPDSVKEFGINAKMNEFEAAMGLCVLDDIDEIIEKRQHATYFYESKLNELVLFQKHNERASRNYSYFPIVFDNEQQVLTVKNALAERGINTRRYFYPSLDRLPYIDDNVEMKNSRSLSQRILNLPLYEGLPQSDQLNIINLVKKNVRKI